VSVTDVLDDVFLCLEDRDRLRINVEILDRFDLHDDTLRTWSEFDTFQETDGRICVPTHLGVARCFAGHGVVVLLLDPRALDVVDTELDSLIGRHRGLFQRASFVVHRRTFGVRGGLTAICVHTRFLFCHQEISSTNISTT
jgi:hypothetical protein